MARSDCYPFSERSRRTSQLFGILGKLHLLLLAVLVLFPELWLSGMPRSERRLAISEGKLWLSCQTRFGFTRASRSHGPWR